MKRVSAENWHRHRNAETIGLEGLCMERLEYKMCPKCFFFVSCPNLICYESTTVEFVSGKVYLPKQMNVQVVVIFF